jgi:hypothetical protein
MTMIRRFGLVLALGLSCLPERGVVYRETVEGAEPE